MIFLRCLYKYFLIVLLIQILDQNFFILLAKVQETTNFVYLLLFEDINTITNKCSFLLSLWIQEVSMEKENHKNIYNKFRFDLLETWNRIASLKYFFLHFLNLSYKPIMLQNKFLRLSCCSITWRRTLRSETKPFKKDEKSFLFHFKSCFCFQDI